MPRQTLTEGFIRKVAHPSGGRAEYFDAKVQGLSLRVTPTGKKSWSLMYRERRSGKQRRMSLGSLEITGLADARDQARRALAQVQLGEDPRVTKTESHNTVSAACDKFIERYARPKNKTWKQSKRVLDKHVIPEWGDRGIDEITRKDVVRLIDKTWDNYPPHSSRILLAVVRKMFNWLASRGELDFNPAQYVASPVQVIERDRVLSDDELKAIWSAAGGIGHPFGTAIRILILTGQRRSEVATMRWQDIAGDVWRIPRENTKLDRAHEVPLSELAQSILRKCPRQGDYIFPSSVTNKPMTGFSRLKKRLDANSGVTDWRIHDIRRTVGTGLARSGVEPSIISRVLNHAEGGVTKIYNRYSYLDEKRKALVIWSDKVSVLTATEQSVQDCSTEMRLTGSLMEPGTVTNIQSG